jgi:hypothetical protein
MVFFRLGKVFVVSIGLLAKICINFADDSLSSSKRTEKSILGSYGISLVTETDFLRGSSSPCIISLGSAILGLTSSFDLPLSNYTV